MFKGWLPTVQDENQCLTTTFSQVFQQKEPCLRSTVEKSRDRVLTVDELSAVWTTSESLNSPYGPYLRMVILTAPRRTEVASKRWRCRPGQSNLGFTIRIHQSEADPMFRYRRWPWRC
jgi:hypothetical protein